MQLGGKLVSPLLGLEEVQLDRAFPLEGSLSPDENEPKLPAPALRLPFLLEESQFPVGRGWPPHPAFLHQTLQLRESLERHRNREFGPKTLQRLHHFVAEKSAVHPNLHDHARCPNGVTRRRLVRSARSCNTTDSSYALPSCAY